MIDIRLLQVNLLIAAAFRRVNRREVVSFRQPLDVAQAGVAADRPRAFAHQLHAVVVHRVMAGGHFNPTVDPKVESGKIDLFGAGKTDIQHVNARIL
ncbi:hypothetical protein D3C75_317890 [compost metagenome]